MQNTYGSELESLLIHLLISQVWIELKELKRDGLVQPFHLKDQRDKWIV